VSGGTLLFGATDLASLCIVEDLSDFWSSSGLRGDLSTSPGIDGAEGTPRPRDTKVCSGQVTVADGDTLADLEDGVAAVKALLRPNVSQVVTRRKVTGAGNLDATQNVIVRGAEERWQGAAACTLLLSVELLDGIWYGDAVAIADAAGVHTIGGDASTHRMTLTLAAGAARTITNTTNGHAFTFGTTVPAGGVLVDVEAQTATAITGGADMSRYLSWLKTYPMRLEAGGNTLTVSAGTASISYQPAYL
jgi:hypothetical protein